MQMFPYSRKVTCSSCKHVFHTNNAFWFYIHDYGTLPGVVHDHGGYELCDPTHNGL